MEQTPTPSQGTPQPVGVPPIASSHLGMKYAIGGIICAAIAILFLPPVFGIAGIILGMLAIRKGERTFGITAIVLAVICMVVGMIFVYYIIKANPDLLLVNAGSMSGAIIQALR